VIRTFIGRAVESRDDRVTYQVSERVRGELGDHVKVRDEQPGATSIGNLPRTPGKEVALFCAMTRSIASSSTGATARSGARAMRGWPRSSPSC
jgi:hypothetical protein